MRAFILLAVMLMVLPVSLPAQVEACLTLANEHADSGYYHFDIYLATAAGSGTTLYLGDADLAITYNSANFSSPLIEAAPGYCSFVPTTAAMASFSQTLYETNTSPSLLSAGNLIINVASPAPGSQTGFNNSVARIDGTTLTHRLGRFKISGYNGGGASLAWKTTGALSTEIYSLATSSPWTSTAATVCIATVPLPVRLLSFDGHAIDETAVELRWHSVQDGATGWYEVEKLNTPSGQYYPIGMVQARGAVEADYSFSDRGPLERQNFYRLRIEDMGGAVQYSQSIEVQVKLRNAVQAFPNPTQDRVRFASLPHDGPLLLELYQPDGRRVLRQRLTPQNGQAEAELSRLGGGIYRWRLTGAQLDASGTLLKENP